jgi:hypothetical protein
MIIARHDNLVEQARQVVQSAIFTNFNRGSGSAIISIMWSLNYCLLVFISVLGILQLAAVYNNFRGLLFFPRAIYNICFAVFAIGFALFAFFTWYDFNSFVVEGSQQTGSFVLSAAAGIVFTLVFSSIINHRRFGAGNSEQEGLDALRETTFFQAIRNHRGGKER